MIQRECDRCGVQKLTPNGDRPSDWGVLNVPRLVPSGATVGRDARTLDLCPKCLRQLHVFAERLPEPMDKAS